MQDTRKTSTICFAAWQCSFGVGKNIPHLLRIKACIAYNQAKLLVNSEALHNSLFSIYAQKLVIPIGNVIPYIVRLINGAELWFSYVWKVKV